MTGELVSVCSQRQQELVIRCLQCCIALDGYPLLLCICYQLSICSVESGNSLGGSGNVIMKSLPLLVLGLYF
ncbi:hypothetical protein AQ919_18175 [Burkholderia pseudomallei]|nr:hypothetical protein AQ919_18175 [Burkholderia pseudomallei]ONC69457.1 hypothetical protein AQ921_21295 [Burkholderia pseudomallei]